jgi:spermidine synthase
MKKASIRPRLIYFLVGAVSLLFQVILVRRLLAVFFGNELTIGALFAGWMFWFGLGGLIFVPGPGPGRDRQGVLSAILFLGALAFMLGSGATWLVNEIFHLGRGDMAGLGTILLAGFALCAPVCVLLGAGFNFAAAGFGADEKNLVSLYLWESLGSAAAGLLSMAMVGVVSATAQVIIGAMVCALTAALVLSQKTDRAASAAAVLAACLLLLAGSGRIEKHLVAWRWPGQQVLLEQESKYSTVTVTAESGQVSFWMDGYHAFSYPDLESAEYAAHLPLSMCKDPGRVLLIGGGLAGPGREILKYPVRELVYVQIDKSLPRLEQKYIRDFSQILKSDRVRVINQDAWMFLMGRTEKFDAIILNFSSPGAAGLNRYFTKEFFQLARQRLNPEGVLGLVAGGSGNYLSEAQAALLGNALVTLNTVFNNVALLPLGRNYLVGGNSDGVTEDPEKIISRLKTRGIETRYVRDYFLRDNLSRERVETAHERASPFMFAPANTLARPSGYYLATLNWLEQAGPGQRELADRILEIGPLPFLAGLLAFLALSLALVAWGKKPMFAALAIFAIGFGGICAELVLLIAFQSALGNVYYLLGFLVAVFMTGLAAGAFIYQRFQARLERRVVRRVRDALLLEAVSLMLCWVGVSLLFRRPQGIAVSVLVISSLMFLVALFSGLGFALCARLFHETNPAAIGRTAGWINAWDHFGSAASAFLVAAFMAPMFEIWFGLWFSVCLMVAVLVAGLVLLRSV